MLSVKSDGGKGLVPWHSKLKPLPQILASYTVQVQATDPVLIQLPAKVSVKGANDGPSPGVPEPMGETQGKLLASAAK